MGRIERVGLTYIHYMCKTDSSWEAAAFHRELLVLCDDLEGWDRGWVGREVQEGGDMCIHVADSRGCTTETNTACKATLYPTDTHTRH